MGLFHYYNSGHAEIFVFDDFLIKQIKEGEVIDKEELEIFNEVLDKHFNNKNMAYISNRVTSYSVNPLVYKEAEKISNLVAIAIIPADEKMKANAEYERQFYNKPFGIFDNLSDAIKWVHKIVVKANSKTEALST
ncbi:hypothetical protein [uncultured Winogradskyella sp.]|uniref:hypothetical protein n=1 Tax=uncultured Winogradskyella sp. TaxID=395353 RepID=UPI002624F63A|nr:hypothetical protein [uncultured Winogradskyella sp.]